MKKIIAGLMIFLLTFSFSIQAFAHSHLSETSPADGETITETLEAITLNFDGKIMEGSFIELYNNENQQIEITNLEIGDGYLKGTLEETLPNGEYHVKWSIISADGHPLEGEYSFIVDIPSIEETNETNNDLVNQDNSNITTDTDPDVNDSNTFIIVVLIIAVVLIIFAVAFLVKRKK